MHLPIVHAGSSLQGQIRQSKVQGWATEHGKLRSPRDDDINYTVLGMLILEQHGLGFGRADVMQMWLANLPLAYTFGPERRLLARTSAVAIAERLRRGRGLAGIGDDPEPVLAELVASWNPGDELCAVQIRADAYGYACPGRPRLAATLAWRDAG